MGSMSVLFLVLPMLRMTLAFVSALIVYAKTFITQYILPTMGLNKTLREKKTNVEGYCGEHYEAVRKTFESNFEEHWEAEGAAFAVYSNGELVVDLWGGFAHKKYNRLWKEDTLSSIFSITKSITAMCFAMQVDRGFCKYEDVITKFWPEFGKNGKEDITVEMVLEHKAGIPFFHDKVLSLDDLLNPDKIDEIILEERPQWTPGTKTAYHPLTFGWLCDAIFRRIDPEQRSVEQFFKEEIQEKHNIDVYIGDCSGEEYRIAHLELYSNVQIVRECAYDRQVAKTGLVFHNPKSNFHKAMKNMKSFGKSFTIFNNPDLRIRGQPGVNGVGTARGLAKVHQVFMEGHFVGKNILEELRNPQHTEYDHTIGEQQNKGRGWMYWKSPKGNWQYGHSGVGGQNVRVDTENNLVYAYLCNGMKAGSGDHVFTFNRLERKLYECIKKKGLEKKE